VPAVLAGDYTVMPTDLDVYAPERWQDDALFRPEVCEAYRRLVAQGWTDAVRELHPGERVLHLLEVLPQCLCPRRRASHRSLPA
jgi:exodeoxyribonuclease-3